LKPTVDGWSPEVVKSVASEGRGIAEIAGEIQKHRDFLQRGGFLKKKREARLLERTRELVNERLQVDFWSRDREALLVGKVDEILSHRTTPYGVADELFTMFQRQKKAPSKMKGR
jgi:LAO/AO transport system kinase